MHYGANKGTLTGTVSPALTTQEQADIKSTLDDFEMPVGKMTSTVTANGVTVNFSGPWAGVRGGLAIGIRF